MKFIKKNQLIVYIISIALVAIGYLNYVNMEKEENVINENMIETSVQMNEDKMEVADIGDAQLVSNNEVIQNDENESDKQEEYYVKAKLERNTMYSQMLEMYEKILNSSNELEMQKQMATEEIKKINNIKNSIMICENLILTKGFDNNVVFVNGESVNVIIEAKELKQEEIAQIQNIVSREIGTEVDNIHIIKK